MPSQRPQAVTIDEHAVDHLVRFCQENNRTKLFMVADQNTYAAQGKAVEAALRGAGFDLKQVVFTSAEVVADAQHVLDVLVEADRQERTFIAVGSGTLTDITRFASHRTKTSFISVPTAPSVDGFASVGAPLIIHGVKITVICHAPIAIFADIRTLANAPRAMIAAGFADMLGKYTSIADLADRSPAVERAVRGIDCRAHTGGGRPVRGQCRGDWRGLACRSAHLDGCPARIRLLYAGLRHITTGIGSRAPLLALLGDEAPARRSTGDLAWRKGRRGYDPCSRAICPDSRHEPRTGSRSAGGIQFAFPAR